jgi:TonB family protein
MNLRTTTALLLLCVTAGPRLAAQPPTGGVATTTTTPPPTPENLLNPQTPDRLIPGYVGGMGNANVQGIVTVDGRALPGPYDRPPKVDREVKPGYPPVVLVQGVAGEVKLSVLVDGAGEARDARVSFSPHPEFELAAVDAALQWKFKPATKNGQPVPARYEVTVRFQVTRAANAKAAVAFAAPAVSPKNYPVEYQYDKAPEVKLATAAVFPYALAAKKGEGTATLVFLIDPLGHTRRIEVRESSDPEVGAAAAAMMASWQFTPAKKGGKPTWTMLAQKHTFGLTGSDSVLGESAARLVEDILHNPAAILENPGTLDAGLKPRYQVGPAIPEEMLVAGTSADAEIEVIVDRTGRVQLPRIVSATREDFGWAAATAVNRWLFVPPRKDGQPVDVRVRIPLGYEAPARKKP